jgi:hypothetical protein
VFRVVFWDILDIPGIVCVIKKPRRRKPRPNLGCRAMDGWMIRELSRKNLNISIFI